MKHIIVEIATNSIWIGIASICSIIGLIISIILLCLAANLKKKIKWYAEIKRFNTDRNYLADRLSALKDLIAKNKILDDKLISDLSGEIHNYSSFINITTLKDRIYIRRIEKHLKKEKKMINKQHLCNQIAYFISRYGNDREEFF
ncbi:hypothetical protein D3P09_09240 [Paenibacillus pinisoli]|uniref:Uncharacterized protein n=1 Tax=Paenibacillus pinisoli TaxID=1276110 RepID=A0A3A6PMW7_9BACL|nr:hypothetical protein [Paenibacillus pinisoli]RJX39589.1 hypothetical protein D3P09_09240 [Paenibacillus pinisoli]